MNKIMGIDGNAHISSDYDGSPAKTLKRGR